MTKDQEKFILDEYKKIGIKKCSQILKLSEGKIAYFAKKNNLIKHHKKQFFDTSFIKDKGKITKEIAYIIGYLWADGAINKNSVRLGILEDDGQSISRIIDKTGKWSVYKRQRKNRRPQMDYFITNKEFASFLKKHGKYSHTIENHEKIYKFLGDYYFKYFLRGLIDGDGCYSIIKSSKRMTHTAQLIISARFNQDWNFLVNYCQNKYGLNFKIIIRKEKNGNTSSKIRCSSTRNIINFIKSIYDENDNIWLNRKKEKVNTILSFQDKIRIYKNRT